MRAPHTAMRILVVEDDELIANPLAQALQEQHYAVDIAYDGEAGWDFVEAFAYDLIVLDVMLPKLDGISLCRRVRSHGIHSPIILLTAQDSSTNKVVGLDAGADDYITKPFEDIELLNAIEVRLKKIQFLGHHYAMSPSGISQFLKDVKDTGSFGQLAEQYSIETYSKKQPLYHEGKRPRYLYYLVRGKVKAFKIHEDGKEYITDILSDGDFIGYHALINDSNYADSTLILEEAEIMQIPREDFLQMIYKDIQVAAKFIHIITQNIKEKEERLISLAYSSLRKRVAKALVDIHSKYNSNGGSNPIEISRDDIAHYIGTATESLIRTLSDFKAEKLIQIKESKIIITDIGKLQNLLY